jgi:hypothetical protein
MKEIKWASLMNLSNSIPEDLIEEALEQSWRFAYDSTDWNINLSSSTSGMYGKWIISISPTTTVKDVRKTPPIGVGGDLIEAFKDFTIKMKEWCDKEGFKR